MMMKINQNIGYLNSIKNYELRIKNYKGFSATENP